MMPSKGILTADVTTRRVCSGMRSVWCDDGHSAYLCSGQLFSGKSTKAKGKTSGYTFGKFLSETRTMPEPHLARMPLLHREIGLSDLLLPASQALCQIAHPSACDSWTASPHRSTTGQDHWLDLLQAGSAIATVGQEVHKYKAGMKCFQVGFNALPSRAAEGQKHPHFCSTTL